MSIQGQADAPYIKEGLEFSKKVNSFLFFREWQQMSLFSKWFVFFSNIIP